MKLKTGLSLAILLAVLLILGPSSTAEDPAPQAASGVAPEEEDDTFIPSEKVPADSALSFPVDI